MFFAGYFLTLSADVETGSRSLISLVSLHPITALSYGVQIIGSLEDAGVGVVFTTLTFSEYQSGYNFATAVSRYVLLMWRIFMINFFTGVIHQSLRWTKTENINLQEYHT